MRAAPFTGEVRVDAVEVDERHGHGPVLGLLAAAERVGADLRGHVRAEVDPLERRDETQPGRGWPARRA